MAAPQSVVNIAIRAIDQTKAGFTTPIKNAKDLAAAMKKLAPAAAVAGTAIAGAFGVASKQLIDLRQQMAEFSDRIGISIDELSRLKFAASQNGVSFDTLQASLQAMTRRIGDAADGSGAAAESLKKMGISAEELFQLKPEQQFLKIAQGFDKLKTSSERADAAQQIFSRSGVQLLQLLGGGSQGLDAMRMQADALGITISESSTRAVQRFNELMGVFQGILAGIVNQFLEGFLPALNAMATPSAISGPTALLELMRGIGEAVGNVISGLRFLNYAVSEIFGAIAVTIENIFKQAALRIIQSIDELLQRIPKKLRDLVGLPERLIAKTTAGILSAAEMSEYWAKTLNNVADAYNRIGNNVENNKLNNPNNDKLNTTLLQTLIPPKPGEVPGTTDNGPASDSFLTTPAAGLSVAGLPSDETLMEFAQRYTERMNDIQQIGIETFTGIEAAMSSAFAGIIDGTMSAKEAFQKMGQNMLSVIASIISRLIVANILTRALGFFGFGGSITNLRSIVAPGNIGALDLAPAFAGMAHNGLSRVPREGTYILDEGERVLSARQNADLVEFMEAGGSRPVNIMLDGSLLARTVTNLSDRGLIEIRPSVVI